MVNKVGVGYSTKGCVRRSPRWFARLLSVITVTNFLQIFILTKNIINRPCSFPQKRLTLEIFWEKIQALTRDFVTFREIKLLGFFPLWLVILSKRFSGQKTTRLFFPLWLLWWENTQALLTHPLEYSFDKIMYSVQRTCYKTQKGLGSGTTFPHYLNHSIFDQETENMQDLNPGS